MRRGEAAIFEGGDVLVVVVAMVERSANEVGIWILYEVGIAPGYWTDIQTAVATSKVNSTYTSTLKSDDFP